MMIRGVELSYIKAMQAAAFRSFRRTPGSFKLPPRFRRSRFALKSLHDLQRTSITVFSSRPAARRRTLRTSWSKRLATLVHANTNTDAITATTSSQAADQFWWTREVSSLPNLITCTRIASAPLLGYFIATEQTNYALMGCGMAAVSDWLDGFVARKYNLATRLGSYLDPLGDKVVINVIAVSLLWTPAAIPLPVVGVWLLKDVLLVAGTTFHWQTTEKPALIRATMISKVNTGLQFAALAVALSQPLWDTGMLMPLCYTTSCTTVASILSYRHLAFPAMSPAGSASSN